MGYFGIPCKGPFVIFTIAPKTGIVIFDELAGLAADVFVVEGLGKAGTDTVYLIVFDIGPGGFSPPLLREFKDSLLLRLRIEHILPGNDEYGTRQGSRFGSIGRNILGIGYSQVVAVIDTLLGFGEGDFQFSFRLTAGESDVAGLENTVFGRSERVRNRNFVVYQGSVLTTGNGNGDDTLWLPEAS